MKQELTPVQQALKDMLWDALRRDPERKDRRKLPPKWGTKTVQGLAASIVRVVREHDGSYDLFLAAKEVVKFDVREGYGSDDTGLNLLADLGNAVEEWKNVRSTAAKGTEEASLVNDLWWFIENGEDTPDRTERFFALRERVRAVRDVVAEARAYDARLTAEERVPTADDYNALMAIIIGVRS